MSEQKFEISQPVSIIIAGVIIAGAIVFVNMRPAAPAVAQQGAAPAPTASANVPAPNASDHITGSLNAPIVLIEYSDFQCPFCQMIHPTLRRIVSESNGQIAWIMREYPLYQIHQSALPSANAAECIADQLGSDGFFKFADAVFADQDKMSDAFYSQIAQVLGANSATYNACVSSKKFASRITQETTDAQNSGGNGTPYTIIVNTKTGKQYPISGALPYDQIMAVINQAK